MDKSVDRPHAVHSTDAEKQVVEHEHTPQTAQDWDGPNDPENPFNWPTWKKAYHTMASAVLGFSVTCGSSLITPSFAQIEEDFHTSITATALTLSLFVLGLGLGPIIAAPISEIWGRAVVYRSTAVIWLFFILGAGFSTSFGSLLVCRLLAGLAGGPCLAVGAGTNADMYRPHQRAVASTFYVMMPFLGPAIGPVVGGFTAAYKTWRWSQWSTIFIGLFALAMVLPMSETYKKVLLKRRAKKLGLAAPASVNVPLSAQLKTLFTITLIRPLRMLCSEPIVILFSLYNAMGFSIMFSFFEAYPYVFESVYGFNTWQYGLTFLALGLGVVIAAATAIAVDRTYYTRHYKLAVAQGRKQVDPEYRLLIGQIGSVGIPIGLFWFAWTSRSDIHWIVPTLAGIPFAWGNLCIFICGALYLIDVYGPLNGASAIAANGVLRYGMGAAFPLFVVQMYRALGIGWATSLLGFITVAMMPIPFIFFGFGPRIRARSGLSTVSI
ncbi:hypothetical protein AMS68_006598 [Peltaster fructicola]|uniref:Major facilitator superfamily (MFS) profile domain-containing protein n=1 Tax=Peltaster fructicola TaxID=286661 RepID=A0A6H0Y2D7_9PEZI|nr:hypothetical protein AMS68_006598 [Peltaster fructicola]